MGDFGSSSHLNSTMGDGSICDGQTVATFVYARLHNFSAVCNALGPDEAASFVNEVRRLGRFGGGAGFERLSHLVTCYR